MITTSSGPDGQLRCSWCSATADYIAYHDNEWGFPVDNDYILFEKICLESFQSGLSWRTILTKREGFREAFLDFDFEKISHFTQKDVEKRLQNSAIVRHRGKIEALINNAKAMLDLIDKEGSFAAFIWRYAPEPSELAPIEAASTTVESTALSKELKKRGWKFVGPTTVYAFMQAAGLVNDHHEDCIVRAKVNKARKRFKVPK